jgi:hypothetical protein
MTGRVPTNISIRTKKIMSLALVQSEDSDSNIDSDDSYVPDEDQLSSSDHDSESETREEAILCENKDDAHDQDDNVSDKELRHLVLTLPPLSHVTRLLMKAALVLVKK